MSICLHFLSKYLPNTNTNITSTENKPALNFRYWTAIYILGCVNLAKIHIATISIKTQNIRVQAGILSLSNPSQGQYDTL